MDIGTSYNLSTYLGTTGASSGTSTSALVASALAGASSFGPATQVSIASDIPAFAGFTDYSQLSNATGWQFDLSGVMSASGVASGVPTVARSEEQQKADAEALQLALNYIDGKQYTEARQVLDSLLEENPTNAAAVQAMGNIELGEGDAEKAEQLFLKAHALNPSVGYDLDAENARILKGDDADVLRQANIFIRSGVRRDDGIRLLISLTDRNPENTAAHVALGDALLNEGDGANGLLQFNAAIRGAKPEDLGMLATKLSGLVEEAPSAPYVRQLLGKVELQQGRYDDALQTLKIATELADDPIPYERDLALAYLGVGRERLDRGDLTGAMSSFERAKELNPSGAEVKAALAEGYVMRAEQHTQRHDYSSALEDYGRAAGLLGSTGNREVRERAAHSVYALALRLQRERVQSGEEIDSEAFAFQTAYELDSSNTSYKQKLAEVRNALGDQHWAAGEYEEAASAYRRALDLYKYNDTYQENTLRALVAWGDEEYASYNHNDAVAAYLEAYKLDTTNVANRQKLADAYNRRGVDHIDWQRWTSAVSDFRNAMQLFPDNAEYKANYASVSHWDPNPIL